MKTNQADYPVRSMCRVLGLFPSGYYAWVRRPPSARAKRDAELVLKIRKAYDEYRQVYGRPRLYAELKEAGEVVGEKRVVRLAPPAVTPGRSSGAETAGQHWTRHEHFATYGGNDSGLPRSGFAGGLARPHQMNVDQEGNVYVASYAGPWVNKFMPKPGADPNKLIGQPLTAGRRGVAASAARKAAPRDRVLRSRSTRSRAGCSRWCWTKGIGANVT